jgi:hypothetical protein
MELQQTNFPNGGNRKPIITTVIIITAVILADWYLKKNKEDKPNNGNGEK